MVRGIFAGDAKDISVKAIAESLHNMEQEHGGILKSSIKSKIGLSKMAKAPVPFPENEECDLVKKARKENWKIWSLEGGLELLIDSLKQRLINEGVEVYTQKQVQKLVFSTHRQNPKIKKVKLIGDDFQFDFQHSILALPAYSAAKLLGTSENSYYKSPQVAMYRSYLQELLLSIPYVDVAVVNVEYDGKLEDLTALTGEAFGLLVPSSQKEIPILGIIFDTCAFPQRTLNGSEKSVFTVMMGGKWFDSLFGSNPQIKDIENTAVAQIKHILKIDQKPSRVLAAIHRKCIAQYIVGHKQRVQQIRQQITENHLPIGLVGSAYDGVGINDAILSARQHVKCL